MTPDRFQTYDGAYVLGSLSTADRTLFEEHLETCDACMQRVAALWAAPALLDQAPADAFHAPPAAGGYEALLAAAATTPADNTADPVFPDDLLPTLLAQIRRQRRRRNLISRTATGVAAACVIALAAVITLTSTQHSTNQQAAPTATIANPVLTAQVSVTSHDSWDEVNLICTYKSQRFINGNYTAVAKDESGRTEVVGSWPAIPGQTAVLHTPTTFHTGKITSVSILSASGTTLAELAL